MLNDIAKDIALTVKESVQSGIKVLSVKFEERFLNLEKRLDNLPIPKDGEPGKSITPEDVKPILKEMVDAIELPEAKHYDIEVLNSAVQEAVSQLPAPENGKSVTIEEVLPILKEWFDSIELPEPKHYDYDILKQAVVDEVALIPIPKDGESVDIEEVKLYLAELVNSLELPEAKHYDIEVLKEAVQEAVSQIPAPEDGKSITIEDVTPLLKEWFDSIELPEPKHYDLEVLKQAVKDEVSQIPSPENGLSVTLDDVKPFIAELVREIPAPEDGKSITLEDVKPIIAEAIEEIKRGIPAPEKGEPGKNADPVDMDALKSFIQIMVKEAVSDEVSKIKIPEVKDGENGLDALQIEILPEIIPEKEYARGTYAYHNGGIFRSYERTSEMRGWECIWDGIKDIAIEHDGERSISVKTVKSSGKVYEKSFNVPALIYRDIWKEGKYEKGDCVTLSGSLWVALHSTDERPGEGSKSWRTVAKRGGAGKSAYDIAREAGFVGTREQWLDSLNKKTKVKVS